MRFFIFVLLFAVSLPFSRLTQTGKITGKQDEYILM